MKTIPTVSAALLSCASLAQEVVDDADGWLDTHLAEAEQRRSDCNFGSTEELHKLPLAMPRGSQIASESRGRIRDWAVDPGELETLVVRLRAVILSDDDGNRRTPVSAEEILLWVERANVVLESAAIRLIFDDSADSDDWSEMRSTLLNTMVGHTNPDWDLQRATGDAIAAQTPERMTVFFRWGTGGSPTGAAFSWTDIDFIVMPGFGATQVCGDQNIGLLAHEIGHYLGLPHTFQWIAGSAMQAESFFILRNHDVTVFDGDGRDETLPDPFIQDSGIQCGTGGVEFDGVEFLLPRENAMSYYHPVSEFVDSQITTMRQVLRLRTMQELSADGWVIEADAEMLSVSGGHLSTQGMGGFLGRWNDNDHVLWLDGEIGDTLEGMFESDHAGRARVFASLTCASDFAIVRHSINGQIGDDVDLYSGLVLHTGRVYLGEFDLVEGLNSLGVEIVGVNPRGAFTRYGYGLDYILLEAECVADLNADGTLNFFDVSAFLDAFNDGNSVADINGDGSLNFFDVSAFLSAYLAGCP